MPPPDRSRPDPRPPALNSLFGEILDWMLAPIILFWPISIAATHHVANEIANQPFDYVLASGVREIVQFVRTEGGGLAVHFPASPRDLLGGDDQDTLYYQVMDARGGLVSGDTEIPPLGREDKREPERVHFRDGSIEGEKVRIAYQLIPMPQEGWALIQVAETRNKRDRITSQILSGVLLPQFAIIPVVAALVYLGLSRGLAPLRHLQMRIRRRRPGDLSPISPRSVPEELQPFTEALNDMMARLEQNLQAQQRFIADAAHQLKTPLTGLKTQIELAYRETDPAQLRASLRQIASGTDRAARLTQQLLLLARAEASHEKIHIPEIVDLDEIVRRVAEEWVPQALSKDIDLGFEGAGQPARLEGVPLLLREMASNLIDNAIKYTPRGGRVTVRVGAGDAPTLEVEDTGIGIPEADRERVFERFYRVLGTDADGSGLGLPIVREIADIHRAEVALGPGPGGRGVLARVAFPDAGPGPRLS